MNPIFRPSELRAFLAALGVHPKKSLSQNFLIDGNILGKICSLAQVEKGDSVLEIGPGPGALTQALLSKGAAVRAVERDPLFADALKRFGQSLSVVKGDVLTTPVEALLQGTKTWKIVANLPYQITTPILARFVPLTSLVSSLTVMVQKEVAERMTAQVGTPAYSALTLFLQFYAETSYGFTVEPTSFYPKPKVHSAVVQIKLKAPPPVNPSLFFRLVHTAFQQRRKMLRTALKKLYPTLPVEATLAARGLKPTARPEELSIEDFVYVLSQAVSA